MGPRTLVKGRNNDTVGQLCVWTWDKLEFESVCRLKI